MSVIAAPPEARKSDRPVSVASPKKSVIGFLANAVLVLIGACFLLPLCWLIFASVDNKATYQTKFPEEFSLDNFAAVLTPELTFLPLWNSLIISVGTAGITIVAALLAAYPLSRYQARFNKPFMYGVLFATGLPITAIMVPVYSLFVQFNLLDSIPGTILFMAASSLPIAIFMTKNFMDSVPITLEEAAWIDGASAMGALRVIVVPLMRPGIAVVAIFVFFQAWGNFFVPFILLLSPSKQPAAISIYSFFGQYGAIAYGQLAAFSLVYAVPAIVLYVLVSRGIGGSFALAGAVKG
ncbi:carbohydrate ABC transporter permease [Cryobacterium sp. TMT2-18-3]|uniref:carbohydrate ABC transporter permease n=1 Tax=unclassified Cryobacterium TaxID=2649013 RepID=UPI00106C5CF6|nr:MULTISPECIES: carbohydrate ABC transporter permease [unclassified Cryobacterium]TFC24286.1 carbohydrate ABC transporter permease [Cryobacterium sp. TMT2-18-2]TFC68816.1 carbohydrate ABC transporter permease [Cryobacterium sp. TMT2-18-3]